MTWMPIGKPSLLKVQLSEAAGCSDMLYGTVKAMCGSALRGSLFGEGSSAS
jgi:hypothetical protein